MQFKFGMPVLLSAYPNSKTVSNWEYDDLPAYETQNYRMQFNKNYNYNRFFSRRKYMDRMREAVPKELHQKLIDDFDQDHAVIVAEGAKAGIVHSIMMKPPNVQPVYPLRDETVKTEVTLDSSKKGPVIVVNPEILDSKSALFGTNYFKQIAFQLGKLEQTLGRADFDVLFLADSSSLRSVNATQFFQKKAQF